MKVKVIKGKPFVTRFIEYMYQTNDLEKDNFLILEHKVTAKELCSFNIRCIMTLKTWLHYES